MATLSDFNTITKSQLKFLQWVYDHASEYRKLSVKEKLALDLVIRGGGFYMDGTKKTLNTIRDCYLSDYQRDSK